MQRFSNILCFVGGDADAEPALEAAGNLARHNRARLTLVDVLPGSNEGSWFGASSPDLEKLVVSARLQDLVEMAQPLEDLGVRVETRVETGNPFVELIRLVVERGHDIVIKTAQNVNSPLGGLLGTTALHLMRKCPVPVWVVKPTAEKFGRVLAAVDPGSRAEADQSLSTRVLELAASLAEKSGSTLDVVHAWWLPAEGSLRGRRINLPPGQIDKVLRDVRRTAEEAFDALVEQVDLSRVDFEVHLVKGQPFQVISDFAARSDVAVMGTLSRSGIEGLLIGNTAERVLRRMETSVLAIKPHGFRTPLTFDSPSRTTVD